MSGCIGIQLNGCRGDSTGAITTCFILSDSFDNIFLKNILSPERHNLIKIPFFPLSYVDL